MSTYLSLGDFNGDADNAEIRLGEIAHDNEVVDLCKGGMDNEERQLEEDVGFSTFEHLLNLFSGM